MRAIYVITAIYANYAAFERAVYARYGWQVISDPHFGFWSVWSFGAYGMGLSYAAAFAALAVSWLFGVRDKAFSIWMASFFIATIICAFGTYLVAVALRGV